jgi:hypothetical protein
MSHCGHTCTTALECEQNDEQSRERVGASGPISSALRESCLATRNTSTVGRASTRECATRCVPWVQASQAWRGVAGGGGVRAPRKYLFWSLIRRAGSVDKDEGRDWTVPPPPPAPRCRSSRRHQISVLEVVSDARVCSAGATGVQQRSGRRIFSFESLTCQWMQKGDEPSQAVAQPQRGARAYMAARFRGKKQ